MNSNAQSDSIVAKRSVIALDKVKTVYRGISNPISIAVSDCKSFTVEGTGLREVAEENIRYLLELEMKLKLLLPL